jgi:poly-gamma-glutamate synthesis protein (capsule biosynthesis protein)
MIFCGDIALPFLDGVKVVGIPDVLRKKAWIGNLEGSLCSAQESQGALEKREVFNDLKAIRNLCQELNFSGFGIANNHLQDVAPVATTLRNLRLLGKLCFGAGVDKESAKEPLVAEEYAIAAFGWEAINCIPATEQSEGVNAYTKHHVLTQVKTLLNDYPDKKVVCFMHWNYELELYPQPLDRQLAHQLIDMGVEAVIGCHAHRVQPIEMYKGHHIVYGLGNFAFRQYIYMDGKLKFPEFSKDEIAFEIDDSGSCVVHRFRYDSVLHTVTYVSSEPVQEAPFAGMTDKEYIQFFKRSRIQKKLLPVFYYGDSCYVSRAKIAYIKWRHRMITALVGNKMLFNSLKSLATKLS